MNAGRTVRPGQSFHRVLIATFLSFAALYAPQPLLPELARQFDVGAARIALLFTVVFLCLACAPLAYGAVLRRHGTRRLLLIAVTGLALLQFLFALSPGFRTLLATRFLEGLLYPALFTAAVTYCNRAGEPAAIARRVSIYVAATILGGLAGRLLGGMLGSLLGWQAPFHALGLGLLIAALLLRNIADDSPVLATRDVSGASRAILQHRIYQCGFLLLSAAFIAFSGFLTTVPFRLLVLEPDISAGHIALVYLGYSIGVLIAVKSTHLVRLAGGPVPAMTIGLALLSASMILARNASVDALIAIGFLLSAGLFAIHSILSGQLNRLRPEDASLVNGLYIAIYYSAGAIGSILPLWFYETFGWNAFLYALLGLCLLAVLPLAGLALAGLGAGPEG